MSYSSHGYLRIRAFTASEALPTPNIPVRIYGNEVQNNGIDYSVVTGNSGQTEIIELPTPDVALSLSPNAAEQPYATYNIEIAGKGFYPKIINNVSVFSGILSILPVELVPDGGLVRNINPPTSTNYSIINENEELE